MFEFVLITCLELSEILSNSSHVEAEEVTISMNRDGGFSELPTTYLCEAASHKQPLNVVCFHPMRRFFICFESTLSSTVRLVGMSTIWKQQTIPFSLDDRLAVSAQRIVYQMYLKRTLVLIKTLLGLWNSLDILISVGFCDLRWDWIWETGACHMQ